MDRGNNRSTMYPIDVEHPEEMDRLTEQSKLFTQYIGLHPAQIQLAEGQTVLDIGCGTGQWVLDIARENPRCKIVGLDISQRMVAFASTRAQIYRIPNARFELGDACQVMPYPDRSFDMIHARFITFFQTSSTWPVFLAECHRLLRPGGVMCSTEAENLGVTNSTSLASYSSLIVSYYRSRQQCFTDEGPNIGITAVQERLLRESGFVDIHQQMYVMNYSVGTPAFPKMVDDLASAMQLLQPVLLREKLISQSELELLHTSVLAEMHRDDFSAIELFQTAWGKSPFQ